MKGLFKICFFHNKILCLFFRPGYSGKICEILPDLCKSSPCRNNGTCSKVPHDFICHCRPGFTGVYCQVNIDECVSNPCKNGGACVDRLGAFECHCPPHYHGKLIYQYLEISIPDAEMICVFCCFFSFKFFAFF